MKKETIIILGLFLAFLFALVIGATAQDSLKVKIIKIKGDKVTMKTLDRPRVKLITYCSCPYRKKQIVTIKKP
jgi:hypothetical protein